MTNEQKVRAVIDLMHEGNSESSSCEQVGISRSTFRTTALRVLSGDEYAKALTALAESQAEKLEQCIDDMRAGVIDAQQARVEIDARKWFASKFLPKRYGDKIAHVGGDPEAGDKPIQTAASVVIEVVGVKPDEE